MQFTLKVIGNMIMSLEPTGEEQEKFRANFKLISSSFASLPLKIPGTAFYRGIKVILLSCNIKESNAHLIYATANVRSRFELQTSCTSLKNPTG